MKECQPPVPEPDEEPISIHTIDKKLAVLITSCNIHFTSISEKLDKQNGKVKELEDIVDIHSIKLDKNDDRWGWIKAFGVIISTILTGTIIAFIEKYIRG